MILDLRNASLSNPWEPGAPPERLSFLLSRIIALAPEAGFSDPASASSFSMTLLRDEVADLSDQLALHVERVISTTSRLPNLAKDALLKEWYRQKLEQTRGA